MSVRDYGREKKLSGTNAIKISGNWKRIVSNSNVQRAVAAPSLAQCNLLLQLSFALP
jgi:hypothetical protein